MAAFVWVKDVVLPLAALAYAVFLWYQRDRRKSRAETAVAERTVGADVSAKEAGGLGASVAFVNEAFRVERESKDRQIRALEQEVREVEARCEQKVAERDTLIEELRRQLAEALARIARLEGSLS